MRKFIAVSVTIRRLTGVARFDFMNEIKALSGPEIGADGTIQQMQGRPENGCSGVASKVGRNFQGPEQELIASFV